MNKKLKYGFIWGVVGLLIGVIIDFTPFVYFTIVWKIFLGDTILARQISWITFPIIFLISGIILSIIINKKKK